MHEVIIVNNPKSKMKQTTKDTIYRWFLGALYPIGYPFVLIAHLIYGVIIAALIYGERGTMKQYAITAGAFILFMLILIIIVQRWKRSK